MDRSLLFDLKALTLLNVRIARSEETLTVATRRIAAERFEFSGDWQATVWFDRNRQLVQFRYVVDGHKVVVQLEE